MNVNQESFKNNTIIVIKPENAFDASLPEAIKEMKDSLQNKQLHSLTKVEVKRESQISPGKEMLNFIYDVPETQNLEVKASDLFVTSDDLLLIKQEISKINYIIPKAEVITDYCDLPTIKSDVEFLDKSSTINNSQYKLEQSRLNTFKKTFDCYKSCSLRQKIFVDGHFWKRWLACEFCGYFYTDKFEYCIHYFNHFVKMNTRRLLSCKTNKPSVLTKTVIIDNDPNSFKQKFILNQLLKINSDHKLFECEICFKQFKQEFFFNQHLKFHSDQKSFKCEICFKKFKQKYILNQHLKSHSDQKPFKCEICFKQFKQKFHLNQHLKIHSGEKPFNCKICLKQFTRNRDLNRHFKTHTGEKPFKCEICSKKLTRKSHLSAHLKSHSGKKFFKYKILKPFTSLYMSLT